MCDIHHHFRGKLTIPLFVLPAIFLFGNVRFFYKEDYYV